MALSRFGDDALFDKARKAVEDGPKEKPSDGPKFLDDGSIEFTGLNTDVSKVRYTTLKKPGADVLPDVKVSSEPPAVIEFESSVDASKLTISKTVTPTK